MEHQEYINIVPQAKRAVLFIHGIVGSPNHFKPFLPLVPAGTSLYNLLLDGHGSTVQAFSRTSMSKWENQVAAAVKTLTDTHEQVYIVAHSMGTLFAIEQAIHQPRVKKLFLLAVPIKLFLKPSMISIAWNARSKKRKPNDPVAQAAKDSCSIKHERNIFSYLGWTPRYLELFKKIRYTRGILHGLKTPAVVFQSLKDEMVCKKSVNILRQNPAFSVSFLNNSRHFYYDPHDLTELKETFTHWITQQEAL